MMTDKCVALICLLGLLNACQQKQPSTVSNPSVDDRIYFVAEMNTEQVKSLDKKKTVILLTGGILEEHGPYLPAFTDGYWNEKLRDTLARTIASNSPLTVLIFPTIPLGNSGKNDIGLKYSFPGTYTVRFETLRSVFMDLATELGEQGFRHVFVIHAHGAPNHQRAIDQAADFYNDTYKGHMVNLFGLRPVMETWFNAPKTQAQQQEDGFTVHAGMAETSSMVYLYPSLVDTNYKHAPRYFGADMYDLIRLARRPDWHGYFGSERLANAEFGRIAWMANVNQYSSLVLDIINGKVNPDTIERFGAYMATSPADVLLDSLSLQEEQRRENVQLKWLTKEGFYQN